MSNFLNTYNRDELIHYTFPALLSGAAALVAFMLLGHSPLVRALGLGLAIGAVTLTLRRFGAMLAITGGLAMAFSPAFWSQTGGQDSALLNLTAVVLGITALVMLIVIAFWRKPMFGAALGITIFTILFWLLVGTQRSLRLTTLFSAGLIVLVIDALLTAHPRPDESPPAHLKPYHTFGLLLLLTIGVFNDPLFILLAPTVIFTLLLSKVRPAYWYWGGLLIVVIIGARGLVLQYLDSGWWLYPAAQADALGIHVPYAVADGWHEPSRWVYLFKLVIAQFTPFGVLLGVFGLSRLARWYPPLGIVTMLAYAPYALFGLVYLGSDSAVLLLPLLMIQVIWMTYAVYTFSQWLQKSFKTNGAIRWLAPAAFTLLPLILLFRITGML